jgi:CBS domain-containing protein
MSNEIRAALDAGQLEHEAARTTVGHTGPTADRYASALERYVAATSVHEPPASGSGNRYPGFPPLTVGDVMTTQVVSAYEGALFKEIARALYRNTINAVPVINVDRHVVGVVTASDLLARMGHACPTPRSFRSPIHAGRRAKLEAATARELMTAPALTITAATTISAAARLFGRYRIRSLPVVDHAGALVGMVSRTDLIRLFLRSDEGIRADVERDVVHKSRTPDHAAVQVNVAEGVVTLSGHVARALTARGLVYRASEVPGVVNVNDELTFDVDDLYLPIRL